MDDGYLSLVGRIKELINRGGAKIAPRDIGELLLAHDVVREAVTSGVPDAEYGERVEAADDGGRRRVLGPPARDRPPRGEVPVNIVFLGLKALSTLKRERCLVRCSAIERRRSPRRMVVLGGTSTGTEGRQRGSVSGASTRAARCPWRSRRSARSDAWCIARQRLRRRA